MEKTQVIFRMWQGEVIAIFPEIPSSVLSYIPCESYQHIGQHSACDPHMIILNSTPATIDQFYNLAKELESIGYNLIICRRLTRAMSDKREETWREYIRHAQDDGCKAF